MESGKSFGVYIPIKYRSFREDKKAEWIKAMEISLREIFVDAKEDLLATALRKRKELSLEERLEARESVPEKAEDERKAREKADLNHIAAERVAAEQAKAEAERVAREEAEKARLAAEKENVERRAREEATAKAEPEKVAVEERSKRELPPTKNRIVDMEKLKREEEQTARRPRLVVYDLQDAGDFGPVALILSEALREEIYRTGRYVIVNRENLADVMQETTFQQSGLVDENQAVHLGKGLAASQVVTGRIGALGKSSVLQAKRIDVETFGTLAVQSLKCKRGEEEDLLDRVHDMAMGLTGGN
ncbi:MAG TPA: CsgG/HfaB family protein [Geobacteraceae bacterium]